MIRHILFWKYTDTVKAEHKEAEALAFLQKSVATMVSESGEQVFVVLSAMSGTTNSLIEISNYLYKKNSDGANDVINNL